MKRSDSQDSTSNQESKRQKIMDVPPPNCLRTRRPGGGGEAFAPRERGRTSDVENRLGSMSGASLDAVVKSEVIKKTETSAHSDTDVKIKATDDLQDAKQPQRNAKPSQSKPPSTTSKPPKQLLNEHYSKLQIKSVKNQYTTIQHEKVVKFATAFTCPETGEHFVGGRLKGGEFLEEGGVVWFGELVSELN